MNSPPQKSQRKFAQTSIICEISLQPKDLIPLRSFSNHMSPPDELEGPRLIAGEPATDTASKPVPALTARQHSTAPQSVSPARKPMVLAVLQVFMLMLALAGSSYAAYTVATWTEESDRTTEPNELLVRTEGRDADGLCAEGGSLILIGVDHNLNQYLDGEEVT